MFEAEKAIYTPAESATIALDAVRKAEANTQRGLVLPLLSDYFAPLMPGELCILQAQTSNGKSLFMGDWERQAALQMQAEKRDECIVHVSVEDLVETQIFYELGQQTGDMAGDLARGKVLDWNALEIAAVRVGTIPIYRIGSSIARAEYIPHLHFSNILLAIDYLRKSWNIKPAAIFVDYLQALPFDPDVLKTEISNQRRLQVRQDIYRARMAAASFDCPVILAAQSKQSLSGHNPPFFIPGMYDIEETSSAAQRADRIISLWMPKTTYPVGHMLNDEPVTENRMWVKVAKQRGGLPAGQAFRCEIDFRGQTVNRAEKRP